MATALDEATLQTKLRELLSACGDIEALTVREVLDRFEVELGVPRKELENKRDFLVEVMRQEINARAERETHMSFTVEASGDSGKAYTWRWTARTDEPLQKMAKEWAKAHQVPEEAVGFDVLLNNDWMIVDLRQSPRSLLLTGMPVMRAFPVDGPGDPYVEKKRPRERKEAAATVAPPAKREKVEPRSHSGETPDKGIIRDTDPVKFEQTNPKKAGTSAWDRYEKYKVAKTRSEALALGAAKGDISHDISKGFCKRT